MSISLSGIERHAKFTGLKKPALKNRLGGVKGSFRIATICDSVDRDFFI